MQRVGSTCICNFVSHYNNIITKFIVVSIHVHVHVKPSFENNTDLNHSVLTELLHVHDKLRKA